MFLLLIIDRLTLTNKFIYERELNRVNSVGMLLTIHILDHLLANDSVNVMQILTFSRNEPDVELVSVIAKNRKVLFSTDSSLKGMVDPYYDNTIPTMKSSTIYKSFPLYGNGSDLGYVQIGYSLKNLQSQLYLSTYRMLGIEVGVFFLILLAAWSITSALLEPLSAMKNASNKIAAGDFSIRTPVVTHDIIGELGTALNNMAERLGDLTRNMNDKIVLATGNLSESNDALRKKTIELEASNRKLMELDTLKSDFVTMVSHDLKTPLTSIIGFAKTLLTLNVTPEQRSKYLTIIETEGKRLAQLIGEYLDISKIESGNFTVKKEPVDPAALVREITESTAIHAPSKSIVVTIAKAIPLILGDANQLKRVVINLLDNALRYNVPDKSICVSVDNKNDHVIVSVKDNGPGIRPEEQNLIFDKFFRSSDAVNERTSGNGLGLAIAKGIVNAHDGALWVESEPGKGATFSFNLPAAVSPQEKA